MNGIVLGMAMLVSSTGGPPAVDTSRATMGPAAFTFYLPDDAAASRNVPRRLLDEQSRPVWRRASFPPAQATTAKRFSKTERIIAVAAGASIGWVVGGGIGYAVTPKRGRDDDTSGLKGMIIGAPIGATVGALVGYRLTK